MSVMDTTPHDTRAGGDSDERFCPLLAAIAILYDTMILYKCYIAIYSILAFE